MIFATHPSQLSIDSIAAVSNGQFMLTWKIASLHINRKWGQTSSHLKGENSNRKGKKVNILNFIFDM